MTAVATEAIGIVRPRRLRLVAAASGLLLLATGGYAAGSLVAGCTDSHASPPALFLGPIPTEAPK